MSENRKKRIVLTGGGTAGHVTPNIALMEDLREKGFFIYYIGSYEGIEREMMEKQGVRYFGISTGKLRRYFDLKNFTDPMRVLKGYWEARAHLKRIKPAVVFSKGGFVAVPVVLAARRMGIPVVIHESDISPGLANRICIPASKKVCCNFPETLDYIKGSKAVLTGSPIRRELFNGDRRKGLLFCSLSEDRPVIMVMGGSLGAVAVNRAVRSALPGLMEKYQIIHLCGKGNLDPELDNTPGYAQFEFISEELPDLMAAADLMISRAGANTICELLALRKPNILVPLPANASRGDQLLNAASFERQGFSVVLREENITNDVLLNSVDRLYAERSRYISAMEASPASEAAVLIAEMLDDLSKH